jgi:energy-coupling factor transport system ATP-binding protein
MGEFITVKDMCYTYPSQEGEQVTALDHINLSIRKGEYVAVIGTNGSGKSTLAKHFNALLLPTCGKCVVDGMDTNDYENLWQIRQLVGMVFQNPDNQIVATTVEEDVAFGPENLGVEPKEIVDRVSLALKAVNMEEYRNFSPHLLSGGQKQRVAIAGVLAMHSRCIVLDEPTAMLDPKGRQEVLATVCDLQHREGISVIYITHFMEEAVKADRVIVMEQGRIVMDGAPAEIFCKVSRLKAMGLDVPVAAELAYWLRQKGLELPEQITTDEELVMALCR